MAHVNMSWITSRHHMTDVTHFMSHMSMSHVTHLNKSHHTYEQFMSHVLMSHVTHMNESRDLDDEGGSMDTRLDFGEHAHIRMSPNLYEWVISHVWMSHVTHMNESRDLYDEGGFVGTRLDFGKDASSHQRLGNRVFAGTQGEKFIVRRCHLYMPSIICTCRFFVCRRPQPLTTRQQSFCWHSRLEIYCSAMPACMCLESFVCGDMLWLVHVYVLIHSDMCYDAFMEFIVRQYHLHLPCVVHV